MRADRLISIMLTLSRRGRTTAADLAGALEVSERTIYRDIDALSIAGVPVYTQSGPNGGVFLDENYRLSLTHLSTTELSALFIAGATEPLRALGLNQDAQDAALKLLASLPERQRQDAERLRQRVYLDPSGWYPAEATAAPVLPALQGAVWGDHPITITYLSWSKRSTIRIEPYSLVYKTGAWYLVGRKPESDYRTYRAGRVEAVTVHDDEKYPRDPDFDVAAYWEAANANYSRAAIRYTAEIEATARGLDFIAQMATGRYEVLSQHGDWTRLRVQFGDLSEACGVVVSMGANGRALAPDELREGVVALARGSLDANGENR